MDEDYNMVCGIDKLAELLIERGIEFCVNDEFSLTFKDNVGNLHECWMAGVDENRVNALIVVTPEQLLSVPDLNSIIAENAKLRSELESVGTAAYLYGRGDLQAENARLRELVRQWYPHMLKRVGRDALEQWGQMDVVRELGIEVDE